MASMISAFLHSKHITSPSPDLRERERERERDKAKEAHMDARLRATAGDRRVYEDFVPLHELRTEEGAVPTLVVSLSGFNREQIRVQIDNYGKLRISGERPLADDRWSRFRKDFQAPENCNVSDVRAKFENGVLEVMLPKLISEPTQPRIRAPQKPEAKPSAAADDTKPKAPAEPNAAAKKQEEEEEKKREQIEERKVLRKVQEKEEEQRKDEKRKEKVAEEVDKEGEKGDAVAGAAKKEPESEQAATLGVRNGVGRLKQKVGELGLAFYKPRHPMVNVVVAVVVLLGVGMYLYHKLSRTMEKGGR